jgi:hypothetical protein
VNSLVLSGTAPIVPSGTRSSCYQEPKSAVLPAATRKTSDSNFTNKESNLVSERLLRPSVWATGPICLQASNSNKHFCKSEFRAHLSRCTPKQRSLYRPGAAP